MNDEFSLSQLGPKKRKAETPQKQQTAAQSTGALFGEDIPMLKKVANKKEKKKKDDDDKDDEDKAKEDKNDTLQIVLEEGRAGNLMMWYYILKCRYPEGTLFLCIYYHNMWYYIYKVSIP